MPQTTLSNRQLLPLLCLLCRAPSSNSQRQPAARQSQGRRAPQAVRRAAEAKPRGWNEDKGMAGEEAAGRAMAAAQALAGRLHNWSFAKVQAVSLQSELLQFVTRCSSCTHLAQAWQTAGQPKTCMYTMCQGLPAPPPSHACSHSSVRPALPCPQRMTDSMVAPGFWCSATAEMAEAVRFTNRTSKHRLFFHVVQGAALRVEGYAYCAKDVPRDMGQVSC